MTASGLNSLIASNATSVAGECRLELSTEGALADPLPSKLRGWNQIPSNVDAWERIMAKKAVKAGSLGRRKDVRVGPMKDDPHIALWIRE